LYLILRPHGYGSSGYQRPESKTTTLRNPCRKFLATPLKSNSSHCAHSTFQLERPKAPQATQNAARKSSGDKIKEVRGIPFISVDSYV